MDQCTTDQYTCRQMSGMKSKKGRQAEGTDKHFESETKAKLQLMNCASSRTCHFVSQCLLLIVVVFLVHKNVLHKRL